MDSHFLVFHTAAQCFLLSALVVRPSPYRWMLFPLTAGLNLYCYFLSPTDDHLTNEVLRFSATSNIVVASNYILLTDVQHELRRVGDRVSIPNAELRSRLMWAVELFANPRGLGWDHEPKSVLPPRPDLSRVQFLVSRLGFLATCLLVNDLASIVIRANPFFMRDAPPFSEQPLLWRFGGVLLFAIMIAMQIILPNTSYSILAVGSGMSQPDMWPHIMGSWGDAYTVRRFWGRTWHQLLRKSFSSHGKFLAQRVFKARSGGNVSAYIQLYTAFLISGLIHAAPSNAGALRFFVSQAVGITFEDIIIALAARIGLGRPNRLFRRLGYVWVYCWFVYSLSPWIDFYVTSGGGMPLSLIMGLYCGDWYPKR